jgi:Domain of unknown function (DUF4351)
VPAKPTSGRSTVSDQKTAFLLRMGGAGRYRSHLIILGIISANKNAIRFSNDSAFSGVGSVETGKTSLSSPVSRTAAIHSSMSSPIPANFRRARCDRLNWRAAHPPRSFGILFVTDFSAANDCVMLFHGLPGNDAISAQGRSYSDCSSRQGMQSVELSVLSAVEHGRNTDIALATRIACAAMLASADLDAERSSLYIDLILISLSENVRREVLQAMNSLGFEYQSDFARHYVAQGKAEGKTEGKAEGRVEIVLKQLTLRFGPLTDSVQTRVRGAPDAHVDAVAERVLSAQTLEEALGPLS